MKSNKGNISVALAVTIIVLLVLAGVTLAMLTSDDGILVPKEQSEANQIINQADEIQESINGKNKNTENRSLEK